MAGKTTNADEEGASKIFESLVQVITCEGTLDQQMVETGLF